MAKKQKNINDIDINHANKSIERFYKGTTILAERVAGVTPGTLKTYPMMFASGKEHMAVAAGNSVDAEVFIPYIVNAAFTLELLLKVIIFYEKRSWEMKHDLISLYELVSKETKKTINENFEAKCKANDLLVKVSKSVKKEIGYTVKWTMVSVLREGAKVFESWRYAFDTSVKNPSLFGFGEAYEVLSDVKQQLKSKYES